ncbi:hypothetical protein LMG27952_00872 [Paraburkholderia hiiakae]|uniref:DUF3563 domain-containing protein n=1 Tax=Paraburkholderia hiiakae TaxID=1081782 RepID=A0ABN7HJZ0_9BURK|nr:DUF3563 family protein [Paraburkholderia hiiakae]CAD6517604.1 hypothetical protein LMG27952_00872 [Paraburkholderia hiiakae]
MFARLISKLEAHFAAMEDQRRDVYLASSADLAELERRNQYFDAHHNPFAPYYPDAQTDWRR